MSYTDFFKFLENKDRLIDKLDLTDEQKEELKGFFAKHPNYESKIDWNNKSLQYKDFEALLALEGKTRNQIKKYGKSGKAQIEDLKEGEDYLILAEHDDDFGFTHTIIYYPLTFKGSEVLAKPTTPPEGITGKWCIAGRNYSPGTGDKHWNMYTGNGTDFFFVFSIGKSHSDWSDKYAISRTMENQFHFFNAQDEELEEKWREENEEYENEEYGVEGEVFTLPDDLDWAYSWIVDNKPEHVFVKKNFYIDPNGIIFSKDRKQIQRCPTTLKGSYQIPDGTEDIWAHSFCSSQLSEIIIPDSVTNIGRSAFSGCKEMTSLTIGEGIQTLRDETFSSCYKLQSVSLPDSIKGVEDYVFAFDKGLQKVKLPKYLKEIGRGMFDRCENLQEVIWPEDLTEIGTEAFADCKKLTKVVLPNPITIIRTGAFDSSGVEELEITPNHEGCRIAKAFYNTPLKRIIFHSTEAVARRSLWEFFSPAERAEAARREVALRQATPEINSNGYVPWGCELICTEDNKRFIYEKP